MDVLLQFVGDDLINQPLTRDPGFALEGGRNHGDVEVGFADRIGSGMTGMTLRIVLDFQPDRLEGTGKLGSHARRVVHDETALYVEC